MKLRNLDRIERSEEDPNLEEVRSWNLRPCQVCLIILVCIHPEVANLLIG